MSDHEPSSDLPEHPDTVHPDTVQPDAVQPDVVEPHGAGDADPLAGLLGGLDMGSLLSMAGEMQQQMQQAREEAATTEVEGSAGGGAVRITMTGAMECTGVQITAEAAEDLTMLEDLVLSALRDALGKAQAVRGDDPLGDLGGLGDQLGGLFGD